MSALKRSNVFIRSCDRNLQNKNTNRVWRLEVKWEDGTLSWIPLKYFKPSNPVEIAEYAVANNIEDEHAFKWSMKDVLRKRALIISKVKDIYWRTTHNFGI